MAAMDRWLILKKVTLHSENDGWEYMRRGPEGDEIECDLPYLVQKFGRERVAAWIKEVAREVEIGHHDAKEKG